MICLIRSIFQKGDPQTECCAEFAGGDGAAVEGLVDEFLGARAVEEGEVEGGFLGGAFVGGVEGLFLLLLLLLFLGGGGCCCCFGELVKSGF